MVGAVEVGNYFRQLSFFTQPLHHFTIVFTSPPARPSRTNPQTQAKGQPPFGSQRPSSARAH
ncbi:sugar ABC transporter substrate-binding protein [Anopheles sinensis]|uniref:Sugar ABC transporter substrate-binding protein n=1 Tax=Anopheles sinensis TaxID=74873 RepID=A0A084WPJ6_ANOSI|nr:sugar ABC transporter substrate-binding protein [Anopheles sinensis]